MSKTEKEFIEDVRYHGYKEKQFKNVYKGRMISMSNSFYEKLNNYLRKHPTEGNRSSFIVRIVSDYIDNKNNTN